MLIVWLIYPIDDRHFLAWDAVDPLLKISKVCSTNVSLSIFNGQFVSVNDVSVMPNFARPCNSYSITSDDSGGPIQFLVVFLLWSRSNLLCEGFLTVTTYISWWYRHYTTYIRFCKDVLQFVWVNKALSGVLRHLSPQLWVQIFKFLFFLIVGITKHLQFRIRDVS